jgi:hypothetical protein
MPNDDWVNEIHKDRKGPAELAAEAGAETLQAKSVHQGKAEDFWNTLAEALERIVGRWNQGADEERKVHSEGPAATGTPALSFTATCAGRLLVRVSMDKPAGQIRVLQRTLGDGPLTEQETLKKVETLPSGELAVEGKTAEEFARGIIEDFLTRIR